jgi:N-terminal acetyltransferase B complex non-catalytic subunit
MGAQKIYTALDIKHVQLDSMGYLHCAHLPIAGIISMAKPLYDQTLKFFTASYKDSLEYLAMSYKFGSFSKLQEFMDFRERLSNSLHYSMISVEALIQEIVCSSGNAQLNLLQFQNMKIEPHEDRIKYDELMDNRDLDVMVRWDPMFKASSSGDGQVSVQEMVKEIEKESFVQETELLQLRSYLLRLVAASVDLIQTPYQSAANNINTNVIENGHSSSSSSLTDKAEAYILLVDSWSELFNRIKKLNYRQTSSEFLVNLLPSRLHYMIQLPYEDLFTSLSQFVYNLWIGNEKTRNVSTKLMLSFGLVKKLLNELKPVKENALIFDYRDLQAKIVGLIEVNFFYFLTHSWFSLKFILTLVSDVVTVFIGSRNMLR